QLGAGKTVSSLGIAHHGDRDRGAGSLGAAQHPLHTAFFRRADLPRQRGAGRACRSNDIECRGKQRYRRRRDGYCQKSFFQYRTPPETDSRLILDIRHKLASLSTWLLLGSRRFYGEKYGDE